MADNLPINFAIPAENINVTYDWTDFAEGTGIVEFFCFMANGSSLLNRETIDVGADANRYVDIEASDYAFSLSPFITPQTIKGSAFVCFTVAASGGAGDNFKGYASINKNGTSIASATSGAVSSSGAVRQTFTLPITIPKTKFSIGDTLSVTIGLRDISDSGNTFNLALDPLNRDISTISVTAAQNHSDCSAFIPFKIET